MKVEPHPSLVAFSHDIFTAQIAGGVTRCMIELMRALTECGEGWSAWAGRNGNAMLRETLAEPWAATRISSTDSHPRGRVLASIMEEPGFARWMRQQQPAVLHRTYYPVRDMLGRSFRRVETLHDLWDERSDLRHDRGAPLRSFLKKRACHRADAVVCVSEHTRDEAIARWPELAGRISVIPHGVRPLSHAPEPAGVDRPYFLFVGRRGLYKNFAVAAAALAHSGLHDHQLLCFGGDAFSVEERSSLAQLGLADRVVQVSGTDDRLAGLYAGASALLYPSAFEGFGLPLLEAMVHDCPVIAAPLTSLPEVGGDAVVYADPARPDAWSEAMRAIVENDDYAATLRDRGRRRAAAFSWARSAKRHAELYRQLQ
ncbi:glycosyltransferase family 1 protein [Sphingomonas sp. 7/4-4]|uniref:glycosyltransferase family 4 protein n=1 Tax=Sphingomonas sp. 7/4-4 TaxID=3018446 RepID=UPI0022F3E99B|nr:glycosyltransferase family 1 protein [Sphingomonas sp. 7/4-4]WBY07953.1 glycosyltransferase family 1 protein [Sphingomonas sp. 7/4-4]